MSLITWRWHGRRWWSRTSWYFPGWTGRLAARGAEIQPVRVAGALRGWPLPAGVHDLRLEYRTPGLALGGAIAATALAAYAVVLLAGWPWRSASASTSTGQPPVPPNPQDLIRVKRGDVD